MMSSGNRYNNEKALEIFNRHRGRLFGLAYRMTGTREDSEEVLQEAYIKWHQADQSKIESPEAWQVTVVTRLALDKLRKLSRERAGYIGPWLAEPLVIRPAKSAEEQAELASSLSIAFLAMLERLSPLERAVFLLRDVFELKHSDIAKAVGKSEAAVRQIASRARRRVKTDRPRFDVDEQARTSLIKKFAQASRAGNLEELLEIFAEDISLTSDGGGIVTAARRTVYGSRRIARLFALSGSKYADLISAQFLAINGRTCLVEFLQGKPFAVTDFVIEDGKITHLFRIMNPLKLSTFVNEENESAFQSSD